MNHTIAFFSCNSLEVTDFFKKRYPDALFFEKDIQEYTINDIPDADSITMISAFTASTWNPSYLGWFPRLQYIINRSTGYDNIDMDYCEKNNITIYNVPHYGSVTVAEHAFALIYQFARKIEYSANQVKQDMDFITSRGQKETRGFDLAGKTIGVIGAGAIGRNTIRIAHGFGMNIVSFDMHPDENLTKTYSVQWAQSLPELLQQSDIISLHVPYNSHTHHLINTELQQYFRKGSYLINTSRGEVVDTHTLLDLLESGILAGAGLDVLEDETNFNADPQTGIQKLNHKLLGMDNVVITPHNAFNTSEAIRRIWETTDTTIANILTDSESKADNCVNGHT